MKRFCFFLSFLLLAGPLVSKAQRPGIEFEGRVYFTNQFRVKSPGMDSASCVRSFGAASIYNYKKGHYKWFCYGGDVQYEVYDGDSGSLVDKNVPDTLYRIHIERGDSLLEYTIDKHADTICGYPCDAIHVLLISGTDHQQIRRTIYYAPSLYINPVYFLPYRDYANDKIYALTRGLPLHIVTEFEGLPVEITMTATKVEPMVLNNMDLQPDRRLPVKWVEFN